MVYAMAFSEIALATAAISIAREFLNGTTSGAIEEIGAKVVNLLQRKLTGGFSKQNFQKEDDLQADILAAVIRDNHFKAELQRLVENYQLSISNINNSVSQTGNTGTTIGVNNAGGDQFFR